MRNGIDCVHFNGLSLSQRIGETADFYNNEDPVHHVRFRDESIQPNTASDFILNILRGFDTKQSVPLFNNNDLQGFSIEAERIKAKEEQEVKAAKNLLEARREIERQIALSAASRKSAYTKELASCVIKDIENEPFKFPEFIDFGIFPEESIYIHPIEIVSETCRAYYREKLMLFAKHGGEFPSPRKHKLLKAEAERVYREVMAELAAQSPTCSGDGLPQPALIALLMRGRCA